MAKCVTFYVRRVLEDNTLEPVTDPDGDQVYRVGLVPSRVREAAIQAAYECASREPDAHFMVTDGEGAEVLDLAPIGSLAGVPF